MSKKVETILATARFDLNQAEAHLVRSQGCAPLMRASLLRIVLDSARATVASLGRLERALEDELYSDVAGQQVMRSAGERRAPGKLEVGR